MPISSRPVIDSAYFFDMFDQLAKIGRIGSAIHRTAYSHDDLQARSWLDSQINKHGCEAKRDAIGNSYATFAGSEPLAPIGIGSHSDSVPAGGAYDGGLGMIAALAVIESLRRSRTTLRHPIEWINFAAEEATMAGGTTGSQAMAGVFDPAILDRRAWDGQIVREHLRAAGLDPQKVVEARRPAGALSAFIELHIEQSQHLERTGTDIGIVSGFTGIRRYRVDVRGVANHAGTTPMSHRQDALVAAAPLVKDVQDIAIEHNIVATVGDFRVFPGAANVIPDHVSLVVETRGLDSQVLDRVESLLGRRVQELPAKIETIVAKSPVGCDPQVQAAIATACKSLDFTSLSMPSGAGHDAMVMSHLCPPGMLFVPSVNGISHSKDEFTEAEDCLKGAQALLETVLILDESLNIS